MPSIETLPFLLKQLRMPVIASHWQSISDKACEKHLSYGEYLAELLALEMTSREQKKLQRAIKSAKLPPAKDLASLDFSAIPSVNAMQIKALAEDRTWVDQANNLILFGPSGVGKTHIAAAIGYSLLDQNVKVLFSSTTLMVQSLQQAKADFKLKVMLDRLARYELLILDDFAYVKKSEQETCVLFELIANRYETGSLIITANQPFCDWGDLFTDKVMAVAAIDRLVHHATIINIDEQSYRAKQAKLRAQKQKKEG